jgi:hypothetical protein
MRLVVDRQEVPNLLGDRRASRSAAHSLLTVPLLKLATQMLAPSKATATGADNPAVNVPRMAPSLARNSVTLLLLRLATQTLTPSKTTPMAEEPTLNVPNVCPSLARTLVSHIRSQPGS